jgi:hypothetical protein
MTIAAKTGIVERFAALPPEKWQAEAVAEIRRHRWPFPVKVSAEEALVLACALTREANPEAAGRLWRTRLERPAFAALKRLYPVLGPMPDYLSTESLRLEDLAGLVLADPAVAPVAENWRGASLRERAFAMKRVAELYAGHFGIPAPKVQLFWDGIDPRGGIVMGSYNDSSGTIRLNAHPMGCMSTFRAALDTLVHEATHHLQYRMYLALKSGGLSQEPAKFKQAVIFGINWENPSLGSHYAYYVQPIERHARASAKHVTENVLESRFLGLLSTLRTPRAPAAATPAATAVPPQAPPA